jgi:bifunctional non-homologous end joining protein LigD
MDETSRRFPNKASEAVRRFLPPNFLDNPEPNESPMPRAQWEPPKFIPPQLTLPVPEPPVGDGWAMSLNSRVIGSIRGSWVRKCGFSHAGLDWTDKYRDIASSLSELRLKSAYIDGELCALRPDGTSSFADLQAASDRKIASNLTYLAFDRR